MTIAVFHRWLGTSRFQRIMNRPRYCAALAGRVLLTAIFFVIATSAHSQGAPDVDLDGVPDDQDNCIVPGGLPFQLDTDQDGFGNACDPDYDQDGFVLGTDLLIFAGTLGSSFPLTDHTFDGVILADDYAVLLSRFNLFPFAISGLSCADPTIKVGIDPPCLP